MKASKPVRIRVTKDIQGRWHDDTWYRVGQEYNVVPTEEPYALGWAPIGHSHSGHISAEHAVIIGPAP